jgi:hypothetical protein
VREQFLHPETTLANKLYTLLLFVASGAFLASIVGGQRLTVVFSLAAAGLLTGLVHLRSARLWLHSPLVDSSLFALLRLGLAMTMLVYGIAKVIPMQFSISLYELDKPVRELSPIRLAWVYFGHSQGFQMLVGWAECVPALMLLWRRTTTLGAVTMTFVLANVVAVNVFYEVVVTVNSSIFLFMAVTIALRDTKRLWQFFFTDGAVEARPAPLYAVQPAYSFARKAGRIVYGILTLCILAIVAFAGRQVYSMHEQFHAPNPLYGTWRVKSHERWTGTQWVHATPMDSVSKLYFQGSYCTVLKAPAYNNVNNSANSNENSNANSNAAGEDTMYECSFNDSARTILIRRAQQNTENHRSWDTLRAARPLRFTHNGSTLNIQGYFPPTGDSVRLELALSPSKR